MENKHDKTGAEGASAAQGGHEKEKATAPAAPPKKGAAGGRPRKAKPAGEPAADVKNTEPIDATLAEDLGAEFEFRGDQLEKELEEARREAAMHLETAQRLQAEFDNYRKRIERDQEDAVKRAGQRILKEMLPVIDNLEHAVAHAEASGESSEIIEGVRMILRQLLDVLAKEGVERIDPKGEPFDPNVHVAVAQVQRKDVPEGTCVEVYECGYRMHGRVLRPASVVVSTGGPES